MGVCSFGGYKLLFTVLIHGSNLFLHILPETNSSPLQMDGWKTKFPLGMACFQGMLVLVMVLPSPPSALLKPKTLPQLGILCHLFNPNRATSDGGRCLSHLSYNKAVRSNNVWKFNPHPVHLSICVYTWKPSDPGFEFERTFIWRVQTTK